MRLPHFQHICRSGRISRQGCEFTGDYEASVILPRLLGIPICSVLPRESLENSCPTFSGLSPDVAAFGAQLPQSLATCRQAYREAIGGQVTNGGVM